MVNGREIDLSFLRRIEQNGLALREREEVRSAAKVEREWPAMRTGTQVSAHLTYS